MEYILLLPCPFGASAWAHDEVYKPSPSSFISTVGRLPQKIICATCKEVLYEGELLKSPQDVIKKFEGRCPKCKKDLKFKTESVDVHPWNTK